MKLARKGLIMNIFCSREYGGGDRFSGMSSSRYDDGPRGPPMSSRYDDALRGPPSSRYDDPPRGSGMSSRYDDPPRGPPSSKIFSAVRF